AGPPAGRRAVPAVAGPAAVAHVAETGCGEGADNVTANTADALPVSPSTTDAEPMESVGWAWKPTETSLTLGVAAESDVVSFAWYVRYRLPLIGASDAPLVKRVLVVPFGPI